MEKLEKRRINPIAHVATLAVLILLIFEGLMIGGVFELRSRTVAKYTPWAYEPFLRLVGEHPDSSPRFVVVEEEKEDSKTIIPGGLDISGLESTAIPVLISTNDTMMVTNSANELTIPREPVPADPPTNVPTESDDQIVPVG